MLLNSNGRQQHQKYLLGARDAAIATALAEGDIHAGLPEILRKTDLHIPTLITPRRSGTTLISDACITLEITRGSYTVTLWIETPEFSLRTLATRLSVARQHARIIAEVS
jgi:hypothetical protein